MPAITCPTDCSSLLPVVAFSACNPEVNASEIEKIYISKGNSAAMTTWGTATEWTTRIAAVSGDDIIRELTVSGEKPAPARQEQNLSNFRKTVVSKEHTINFTVDETNDTNYDFMRNLECGGTYRVWYKTKSGHMFGGNTGVIANIFMDNVLGKGENEIQKLEGVVTWKSKFTEERVDSPI